MRYCITGGIGAGKSYVCKILERHGIRIYDCDARAKHLLNSSQALRDALTEVIGKEAYTSDGLLNKSLVAKFLLASNENKQLINAIVHPAVMDDFRTSGMQWMESAILYEAHLENYVDRVIAVTAPEEVRIRRIMLRDNITREKAEEWIEKQIDQREVEKRADYIIVNDGTADVEKQIEQLISILKDTI